MDDRNHEHCISVRQRQASIKPRGNSARHLETSMSWEIQFSAFRIINSPSLCSGGRAALLLSNSEATSIVPRVSKPRGVVMTSLAFNPVVVVAGSITKRWNRARRLVVNSPLIASGWPSSALPFILGANALLCETAFAKSWNDSLAPAAGNGGAGNTHFS